MLQMPVTKRRYRRRKPTAAQRQRARQAQHACRVRRRNGLALLQVEVDEYGFIAALLRAERITETESLQRVQVERALAKIAAEFIARWNA